MGQVEPRIEPERHDAGGCPRSADSRQDTEHSCVAIQPEFVVALRERKFCVQVLPLHPILVLARSIARIGSLLKHRDDYDLDLYRRNCRVRLREGARRHRDEKSG